MLTLPHLSLPSSFIIFEFILSVKAFLYFRKKIFCTDQDEKKQKKKT